jgi:hypothetical protein
MYASSYIAKMSNVRVTIMMQIGTVTMLEEGNKESKAYENRRSCIVDVCMVGTVGTTVRLNPHFN